MMPDLGEAGSIYEGKCSTGTVQCYNMELRTAGYMTKKRHGPYKRGRNHARLPFLAPKNIHTKNVYCNKAQRMLCLVLGRYGKSRSVTPERSLFSAARHVPFTNAISAKDNKRASPTSINPQYPISFVLYVCDDITIRNSRHYPCPVSVRTQGG
jgi:hypothetical protein